MTAEVSFDRQPTFDDESRPAAVSPEADFRLGNWKGHSRAKATIRSSRTVRDGRWLAKAKLAKAVKPVTSSTAWPTVLNLVSSERPRGSEPVR